MHMARVNISGYWPTNPRACRLACALIKTNLPYSLAGGQIIAALGYRSP